MSIFLLLLIQVGDSPIKAPGASDCQWKIKLTTHYLARDYSAKETEAERASGVDANNRLFDRYRVNQFLLYHLGTWINQSVYQSFDCFKTPENSFARQSWVSAGGSITKIELYHISKRTPAAILSWKAGGNGIMSASGHDAYLNGGSWGNHAAGAVKGYDDMTYQAPDQIGADIYATTADDDEGLGFSKILSLLDLKGKEAKALSLALEMLPMKLKGIDQKEDAAEVKDRDYSEMHVGASFRFAMRSETYCATGIDPASKITIHDRRTVLSRAESEVHHYFQDLSGGCGSCLLQINFLDKGRRASVSISDSLGKRDLTYVPPKPKRIIYTRQLSVLETGEEEDPVFPGGGGPWAPTK